VRQLRSWQVEALGAWEQGERRGIVAAATGTGKTRLAIEVLRGALENGARAIVVVPTRLLQDQWLRELRVARLGGRRIGTIGGFAPNPSPDDLIIVAVMDSARTGARNLIRHWNAAGIRTLLIVDECHWAGSDHNKGVFEGDASWRLGLSATPERGDDGFDDVLVPSLGPVVYRYSLKDAMDDGVLGDLLLVNLIVDLSRYERNEYDSLQARLDALKNRLANKHPEWFAHSDWTGVIAAAAPGNVDAKRLNALVGERRRLLAKSSGRLSALKVLIEKGLLDGRRSILFNETIEQAEKVADMVRDSGARVTIDHSRMKPPDREAAHRRFRSGAVEALVVVRTADEGVDVPDADQAVIVSGTTNPRQRVQRLGRVVRLGGQRPRAISLLARGTLEETVVGGRDLELLGLGRVLTKATHSGSVLSPSALFSWD
jgi:superfamily II DNA or RNA helicase